MGVWEASSLKMSGAEFEVQEALLGLQRLIRTGAIRPTTRVILEGAVKVLEGELESAGRHQAALFTESLPPV